MAAQRYVSVASQRWHSAFLHGEYAQSIFDGGCTKQIEPDRKSGSGILNCAGDGIKQACISQVTETFPVNEGVKNEASTDVTKTAGA